MHQSRIYLTILASVAVLGLVGCTTNTVVDTADTNVNVSSDELAVTTADLSKPDFQPTAGKLDLPGEDPADKRLMLATSTDGIQFTSTDQIIADQANVPNILTLTDGTIYLYYAGWTVGTKNNTMAVAISQDNGITWVHKYVTIDGKDSKGGDPDLVLLDDGTFRMYYTGQDIGAETSVIFYADSSDGIHFTRQGTAFTGTDEMAIDSSTFNIGDTWHQFTLVGYTLGHYYATSDHGETFTLQDTTQFEYNGQPYVMANEINTTTGVRFYAFALHHPFMTFTSTDGETWEVEATDVLSLDETSGLESAYIKDPAVAQLSDGTYLMAYVTVIP